MSVSFNQWLVLNEALHGGRRVRRNRRAVSLCAKVAFVSVVALASAGIAAAAPAGGIAAGADSVRSFAEGTTLTLTAADAVATNVGGGLIQLAHHGGGSHPTQSNSGGGFGNTGLGNQGRGNSPNVGNACCRGGGPPGGVPPGPPGGVPPGPGPGPGSGPGLGGGGSLDDPWLLVRGAASAEDGGTQAPGALGLLPGQIACSFGENGLTITSDGQVLFAQYFTEQTALAFGKDGCAEVVNYPDTEETGG